jgi:hypothetical protein
MKFYVMDQTGHSTIEFDKSDEAITEAMAKFTALISGGHIAATRKAGATDYSVTKIFDPTADETLFVPHMKGG